MSTTYLPHGLGHYLTKLTVTSYIQYSQIFDTTVTSNRILKFGPSMDAKSIKATIGDVSQPRE